MSTEPKVKRARKRYSSDEKKEIVAFVEKHDAENGRGGKSAAVSKYGISPVSLAAWIKSSSVSVSTGKKRGRKVGPKNISKSVKVVAAKGGSVTGKLKELIELANQIERAEADLDKLKAGFQTLKAAL